MFPERFGPLYTAQDRRVLDSGRELADQLELHLYFGNQPVWCLTHKLALFDTQGQIVGLAGISRDLQAPQASHPGFDRLAAVDAHIREHFARPVSLAELTAIAGLSAAQLERNCKRVFQLTPRQMIHKVRLEEASRLLHHSDLPITEIALRWLHRPQRVQPPVPRPHQPVAKPVPRYPPLDAVCSFRVRRRTHCSHM